MQVQFYFAYGSNMNPKRVDQRGLEVTQIQGGTLGGYDLAFNKADKKHPGEGHANILRNSNAQVEGVLYRLNSAAEILKMDPFERAPWNYGREVVPVRCQDTVIWAWTYFANPAVQLAGLRPSQDYLSHLLAGEPWLSEGYYERLLQWPVASL